MDVDKIAKTPTGTTPPSTDELLSTIQERLLGSTGIISSEDTKIESTIKSAISGVEQSRVAEEKRLTGQFDREITEGRAQLSSDINQNLEGGRGFAVNIGALREIVRTGDKRLDDLEDRKQELVMQGNALAAEKIANLQLQELTFQQEARQRTFSNLLQLGSLTTQIQSGQLARRSQSFTERSTIASLASQYGVAVSENDTIDTIASRVAPLASEKQRLELAQMRASIAESDARRREALSGIVDVGNLSSENVDALAMARKDNPDGIDSQIVRNPALLAAVVNRQAEMDKEDIKDTVAAWTGSKDSLVETIVNDPSISSNVRANAQSIIENEWKNRPAPAKQKPGKSQGILGFLKERAVTQQNRDSKSKELFGTTYISLNAAGKAAVDESLNQ